MVANGRGMVAGKAMAWHQLMSRGEAGHGWHRLMSRVMASGLVRPDLADKTLISSPHHYHHQHHCHQAFKHRRFAGTLSKSSLLIGIISRGDTSVTDPVGFSTNCSFATSILVEEQCVYL